MENNIFYDEKGKFIPIGDEWGNINPKISDLRNKYMEAEREYFLSLLENEKLYSHFLEILEYSDDELFREAEKLRNKLENGELESDEDKEKMAKMTPEERDQEWAEGNLCLLLAAIRDKELEDRLAITSSRTV